MTFSFRRNTRGAGLVEYGMLAGLVAVAAITSVSAFGNRVDSLFRHGLAEVDTAMHEAFEFGAGTLWPYLLTQMEDPRTDTCLTLKSGAATIATPATGHAGCLALGSGFAANVNAMGETAPLDLVLFSSVPEPAGSPARDLRTNGAGNLVVHDGATSYTYHSVGGSTDRFAFPDPEITPESLQVVSGKLLVSLPEGGYVSFSDLPGEMLFVSRSFTLAELADIQNGGDPG